MAKVMFVGKTQVGKTTLIQALKDEELSYRKTQAVEYHESIIDTPGEYIENPRYYNAIVTMSFDADILALVHDVTSDACYFPPGFGDMFNIKVIGILTKTDAEDGDRDRAENWLMEAGASEIYSVSAYANEGIDALAELLKL
jgi:ethanolamine utilization protein EutP